MKRLEELRRLPGVWISVICTSRLDDELAWSLTCKYGSSHSVVQIVDTDFDRLIEKLADHLKQQNLAAPAVTTNQRKLKLKRSTP